MKRILAFAAAACLGSGAWAAETGELWEVTTQMNMAGMPAGMGAQTQRVCNATGDPRQQAEAGDRQRKCKMTDFKQSGNRVTMTMTCPEGTVVMEHAYNAARTEYNGTMKMSMRDGNQMTMNMSGRKLGACDAQQAKREREEQAASARRMNEQAQATLAASEKQQIQNCARAPAAMDLNLLGMYGRCDQMQDTCRQMAAQEATKRVANACLSSHAQVCKRYQTLEGFVKADGRQEIADSCRLDRAALIAANCPHAAKSENLAYLGRFCPLEAKPLAQKYCAGRSYTNAPPGPHQDFCSQYLARASLDDEAPRRRAPPQAGEAPKPQDAVQQGVTQGINKLKGLFGR